MQAGLPTSPVLGTGATSLPANDELAAQLHHRTVITRAIPKVKHRVVQLQHRGEIKESRTAGLNLRNLLGRGLTRAAGVWVLAAQTA